MSTGSFLAKIIEDSVKTVSGRRAKEFAHEISRFHRIQASPGYHEALEYVRGVLDGHGIETRVYSYPADGETLYAGGWPSPIGWKVKDAELWIKKPDKELISKLMDHPTMVVAHSRPTDGWEEAELVDVGSGLLDEEYPDVEDKLVMATGKVGWVHRMAVVERGAKGLVHYNERSPANAYPYAGLWPSKEEIKGLGVAFSISRSWANKLKSKMRSSSVVLRYRIDSEFFNGRLEVLEARIPGYSGKDILFIAHLCHPKPGGHDNASGSACLMEIALTIRKLVDEGRIKPNFGLRFWWVPEFYGTIAHLSTRREIVDDLVAVLNLDMVGASQERTGGHLAVIGFPMLSPSFMPLLTFGMVERAMEYLLPKGLKLFMKKYEDGSDHHIFADPMVGVPQTAIGEWVDKFYHTDMDYADNLDIASLSVVCSASVATAAFLSGSPSNEAASDLLINYVATIALRQGFREISDLIAESGEYSSNRAWIVPKAYKEAVLSLKRAIKGRDKAVERVAELVFEKLESWVRQAEFPRPKPMERKGVFFRRKPCPLHGRSFVYSLPKERARKYLLKSELLEIADLLYLSLNGKRDLSEAWAFVASELKGCKWDDLLSATEDLEKAGWISRVSHDPNRDPLLRED